MTRLAYLAAAILAAAGALLLGWWLGRLQVAESFDEPGGGFG